MPVPIYDLDGNLLVKGYSEFINADSAIITLEEEPAG